MARLARTADLLRHPGRHRMVRQAVAAPVFGGIRRRQPQLTIKYLHPRYLVRDASTTMRAAIFVHHYRVLRERMPADRLAALLDGEVVLWRRTGEEGEHAIGLGFSHPTDNEGELTLTYRLDSTPIYLLSFSFAPGAVLQAPDETVALVTRLQRAKGCGELFKTATKALRGLAPASAVLAALQGWVDGFGVTRLAGVAAARQVCIADGEAATFHAAYDDAFTALGGTVRDGLFSVPLPPPEKPLTEIKPGNRPRTKAQRELKHEIAAAAQAAGHCEQDSSARAGPGAVAMVFPSAFAQERDGSQARAAALLDRLVAEHGAVIVYSDRDHDASPWNEAERHAFRLRWPSVELALERQSRILTVVTAAKALATALAPGLAAPLLRLALPAVTPVWTDVRVRAGLVVVNYKSALVGLNGVDPGRCFVETHDLLWLKWAKLAGASPISAAALRRLRGEIGVLETTGGVIAISPAEAAFFRMMLGRAPTFYVSAWGGAMPRPSDTPEPVADFDLVFVASGYAMNGRGFCAALERHGRWLGHRRIAVCGTVCDDPAVIAAAARHTGVTLLGFVEDLATVYRRSKAALVPVDGTGLKMKLVSALEAGLPALATPPVFDGLPPGHDGAVFPLGETEAAALLDDPARLAAARRAAMVYHRAFMAAGEAEAAMAAMKGVLRADLTRLPATTIRLAGSEA